MGVYGQTQQEARKKLAQAVAAIDRGDYVEPHCMDKLHRRTRQPRPPVPLQGKAVVKALYHVRLQGIQLNSNVFIY